MKILLQKEFLLFLAIFSGFSASVCAQNNQAMIVKAISDGDAHELVKYFHTMVNLAIPGSEGVYNRNQSEALLQKFFSQNEVLSFKVKHEGRSNEGTRFLIGKMNCPTKIYNLYYLMKEMEGKYWIIQFQLEPFEE